MTPLPPETLWLPFEAGPYRMAMNLTAVPEPAWFEIDAHYPAEIAERHRLFATRRDEVFGAEPGAEPACAETLAMLTGHLTRVHPDWFEHDGDRFHNRLTGEVLDLTGRHPLEQAGLLVQEDLCLIEVTSQGPRFAAATLCFPSRWRLHEKLGRPLAEVHGAVPLYADRLARPVDRFMEQLRTGRIAGRLNWSVADDPALFQPTGKWRTDPVPDITPGNAGDRLFLRVERQTLRRLPASGAILFGIRVHSYPMTKAVRSAAAAARLAGAVRALPQAMTDYKSLPGYRDALLAWLDERAA